MNQGETKELEKMSVWDRAFAEEMLDRLKDQQWTLEDTMDGLFLKPPCAQWRIVVKAGSENDYLADKYNPHYTIYYQHHEIYEIKTQVFRTTTSYQLFEPV